MDNYLSDIHTKRITLNRYSKANRDVMSVETGFTSTSNPVRDEMLVDPEKKKFDEAVADCNAVPLETFISELKKRVKERYQNAKS